MVQATAFPLAQTGCDGNTVHMPTVSVALYGAASSAAHASHDMPDYLTVYLPDIPPPERATVPMPAAP